MKKISIILAIAAVIAAVITVSCCANTFTRPKIKGSGHIVTRTVELPAFSEIEASRAVKVILVNDGTKQARIEADDNLIDKVIVRVTEHTLRIGIDESVHPITDVSVRVTVPTDGKLRELEASSAATIQGDVILTGPELDLKASSAAKIDINSVVKSCTVDTSSAATIHTDVQADTFSADASSASKINARIQAKKCSVEASSAATIQLNGTTEYCSVDTHSAAKFNGSALVTANAILEASSGSYASIHCTGNLNAYASNGASINYTGDCNVDKHISSGGSIDKK